MRIGLKKNYYKKNNHAHTKSVARLVESEIWSKKNLKKEQHAHTKSVARLVDSENWSKKNKKIKKNTRTQKVLLDYFTLRS